MKKLKIKGLKKEMSTTGTGASFAPSTGAQYASPKAFKIKQNEVIESTDKITLNVPLFLRLLEYAKEDAQTDMDLHVVAERIISLGNKKDDVLTMSDYDSLIPQSEVDEVGEPFTKPNPSIPNRPSKFIDYKQIFEKDLNEIEVGDVKVKQGVEYTVTDVNPETGKVTWDIKYVPAFDSVYKEFNDLRKIIAQLDQKTDDSIIDDIASKIKAEFNRYRTHIRKNYPEAYKKFTMNEELNISRNILKKIYNEIGAAAFGRMILDIEDENVLDELVDGLRKTYPVRINEARYSQFKSETKLRTPTEQIHRAVREIRRKVDEIVKVVGHTERMKNELKQSNEGMAYLKRTRNALSTISEKLQELNNRIKGLTE